MIENVTSVVIPVNEEYFNIENETEPKKNGIEDESQSVKKQSWFVKKIKSVIAFSEIKDLQRYGGVMQRYEEKIKVLFICHGNICRSPAALYIFRKMLKENHLEDCVQVSSAATSREELGNPVYPPMRRELNRRGIDCQGHRARQITHDDYDIFDYLIIMDERNRANMRRFYGSDPENKIYSLMSFTDKGGEIPDPWYSGDFEGVCEAIEEGCRGLLAVIRQRLI